MVQAADGTVLVSDAPEPTTAKIIAVNPANGAQTTISSNAISAAAGGAQAFLLPRSLTLDAGGQILVASASYIETDVPTLIRVDRATGRQTVISSGGNFSFPNTPAVKPNGDILLVDASAFMNQGALFSVAANGTQTMITTGLGGPRGLTIYPGNAPPTQPTLSVSVGGTSLGTVTGTGINCPGDCTQSYDDGANVTLTATPASGSTSWAGAAPARAPVTVNWR